MLKKDLVVSHGHITFCFDTECKFNKQSRHFGTNICTKAHNVIRNGECRNKEVKL